MCFKKLGPNLGFFVKKKISIFLGSGVVLQGILIGFDQFMNLVVEKTIIPALQNEKHLGTTIVRGSEIFALELFEN